MASTSEEAAITDMVRAGFAARPVDRVVGRPQHTTVKLLAEQLAPICAAFETTQWGGQHGCLKMVLGGAKYRAVLGNAQVAIAPMTKPADSATFPDGADDTAKESARKKNATLWREYRLQQAVNAIGVATVVAAVDSQYTDQLKRPYLGHRGLTLFRVLEHLRTWYKISHREKVAVKARFEAPWSETPTAHVTTFGAQLDERQIECSDLGVTVSTEDKMLHFVQQMYESERFSRKFMDDWEDSPAATWTDTVAHFTDEFDKIERGEAREAERAGGDYGSAAALTARPPASITTATKADTDALAAVSEYAAALEARNAELESLVDDQTAAGAQSALTEPEVAAAATTSAATKELAALKAQNAAQQRQLDTALAQLAKLAAGGRNGGRDPKKKKRERHVCKNCNRLVWHNDEDCMELEKNAHLRYEGWKSCLKPKPDE